MLGQLIVARFVGREPSSAFLRRVRLGQVGGVILFADNLVGGLAADRALTTELQLAAAAGGNPPLLVMTDQEGGPVRRVPGPPDLAPGGMTSDAIAFTEGRATGRLLRSIGVNVDLAPVADVERVQGSFLGTRSFGGSPGQVAGRACAFGNGLASHGVAYTLKHFPGLGRASSSTDDGPVSISASAATVRADYLPYRACALHPDAIVMVSSAIYPHLTGTIPAVMSTGTYQRELRIAVPGRAVLTISDDLQARALSSQSSPALRAINAGLDLALYAHSEQASSDAYRTLVEDLTHGDLSTQRVEAAARAVQMLKRLIGFH